MAYRNCDLILSVRDAEKDHDKWLKTRDMGIGGSDAAIILGYSSYKSPYQLWMEKTGQAVPPDLSGNQYIYWGHKNEPNIADWFQEETGKKVRKLGTLQNRSFPFMLANVDREDVRIMIDRTMDRNHITDAGAIQPGQKLLVPVLKEK